MRRPAQDRVAAAESGLDFRRLFEGAADLILVLAPDSDFTILGASDAYLSATLTDRDAIVGQSLFELLSDSPDEPRSTGFTRLRASLERLLGGGATEVMPVERRALSRLARTPAPVEERYWRATNSVVRSATGAMLYLVHRLEDVTDLVRADALQARIEALQAQLEQANGELEALGYSVSHDLRAPLRAIDGFSRILEEDHAGQLDSEGRRVLAVIRDSGARMGRLMDDVLTYSRLGRQPMSVATVDMHRLAQEAFMEACTGVFRMPELRLAPLPEARGDAGLLKEVWCNLLGNAVKFSGARERAVVEVSADGNGAETVYSVRDNGVGFDMRYRDKLFGVFQRLHPEHEFPGSGVGLAIVQRLIARHGGRVWGEGAPGEGAAFHFSLPEGASHA